MEGGLVRQKSNKSSAANAAPSTAAAGTLARQLGSRTCLRLAGSHERAVSPAPEVLGSLASRPSAGALDAQGPRT